MIFIAKFIVIDELRTLLLFWISGMESEHCIYFSYEFYFKQNACFTNERWKSKAVVSMKIWYNIATLHCIDTCFWNIEYLNCIYSVPIEYDLFLNVQFYYFNTINNVINTQLYILSNINNAIKILIVQNG